MTYLRSAISEETKSMQVKKKCGRKKYIDELYVWHWNCLILSLSQEIKYNSIT